MLGLKLTRANDEAGWASFSADGGPPFFLVRSEERAGKGGGGIITFQTAQLDLLRERLEQQGVRIDPRVQQSDHVRILTFYDPDGNAVEVSEER